MGNGKQKGFTLIELLVVISIIGFLSAAIAMTFAVVSRTSAMAMSENRVLSQVHLAGNWITRDVQNAIKGTVVNTPGLCSMQCYVLNGDIFSAENATVSYTIDNGILNRTSRVGSSSARTVQVAQFIDASKTTFTCENITENKYFQLKVRASYSNSTFEKVYKIKQVLTP
jgi:prepilin-type N-terminal cleavage/methylation domain-containing protein